jgi:WD40 repeat protein
MIIALRFLRNHWGKALGLLAVAGFLYVVWWALPVRPQMSRHMGAGFSFVGFADDRNSLFIRKVGSEPSADRPVVALDANTGQERATFFGEKQQLERLEISPDGRWIAALLDNKPRQLKILDVATGLEVATLPAMDANWFQELRFQFAPDSRTLAFTTSTRDRSDVVLWDLETRQKRAELPDQEGPLAFARDSRTLATTSMRLGKDKRFWITISLWECSTGRLLRELQSANLMHSELAIAFDKDAKSVGAFGVIGADFKHRLDYIADDLESTHQLIIWDETTGSETQSRVGPWNWQDDMLAANRLMTDWYLLRREEGQVTLLEPMSGHEKAKVSVVGPYLRSIHSCLAFIGDKYDVSISSNGRILLVEQISYADPNPVVEWLAEKLFLKSSESVRRYHTELRFVDMATGISLAAIQNAARDYALSPDGGRLATLTDDDFLCIWDIPPRKPVGWFLAIAAGLVALWAAAVWRSSWRRRRLAGTT